MEYNTNNSQIEKGIDIATIMQYALRVIQKWWAVLLAAVICASAGFVVAKVTYVPQYTCTMRFVIDNKNENTVSGGQSASDINAGMQLARDYVVIMTETNSLMDAVAKNSGYEITGEQVKRMLKGTLVEDTSIVALNVTTSDPEVSFAVATSYLNNYAQTTDKAHSNTRAIVIDEPVMPTKANADNSKLLYTLLGFVFGAGLVVGIICISIFIKDTVKLTDDITNKLNSKLVGSIIHIKKNEKGSLLFTDKKTGFMFIEAFKTIRAKLENTAKRHNYKTFVFTSTAENEGKTTIATNTALALAKNGKSVLLIDADLRKPSVYKTLGVSATNEAGLAGVITGEKTLSESIKYFEKFNLFLLISSQAVSESAELLSADETEEILEAVKNEFDYVIIDTPPAGLVADATILAQHADATVMIVRNDRAPMRRIRKTMEDINGTGTDLLGVIYNDADSSSAVNLIKAGKKSKKGYGYGYGYSYGYGYGYGEEYKNKKK